MAEVQKTNNMPNFKKNTSPAMKRSGFKMKSSPAKNLGNFFGSIFSSEAIKGRQEAQRKSNTGEYKGMTDFEKRRAEKKEMRKTGESKFQVDVRKKREKKAEAKKVADKPVTKTPEKIENIDTKSEIKINPKARIVKEYEMTPGSSKQTFKQAFAAARKANKKTFMWNGNSYTTELKSEKTKQPTQTSGYFQGNPEKEHFGATSRVPLTKKSPYKKGIGSRGYKMKRK